MITEKSVHINKQFKWLNQLKNMCMTPTGFNLEFSLVLIAVLSVFECDHREYGSKFFPRILCKQIRYDRAE